jgi:uncharacterized surface protein with fasciclin (FAS1) repeats
MTNITTLLAKDNYMTTFVKGLKTAGLTEILEAEGPFTVFVPTNLSFGKLDNGVVKDWEAGMHTPKLKALLNHHIVAGHITTRDLTNGTILNTIDGQKLVVIVIGKTVMINKSEVLGRDLEASNGVIHSIDRVIATN